MKAASALYRLLGDEARLRLLRVLAKDRAGHEGLSPVVRVPTEGGTPVGLPVAPEGCS